MDFEGSQAHTPYGHRKDTVVIDGPFCVSRLCHSNMETYMHLQHISQLVSVRMVAEGFRGY